MAVVVRLEYALNASKGEGCQVDLSTFEAHRNIAYKVHTGVTSRHERFSSCPTLVGVAPRIYCPLDLYEITGKGVGICIKVVVAPQSDGKQFANHLRSSILSREFSVGV